MTVHQKTDGKRYSTLEMLERLIAFDTTSSGSNLALIDFVVDYLSAWDVPCLLSYNDDRTKANLLACIGPPTAGGVVLSGHTDVVPVTGQSWSTQPFALTRRNGRLYGRGTADMKSFISVALALVPDFLAADLDRPIYVALSFDEEIGCFGVPFLIRDLAKQYPAPRAVIVGEPTGMRIVNAHKGVRIYRTTVTGIETHSSLPESGVNAIEYAAQLISRLNELRDDLRSRTKPPAGQSNDFDPAYGTLNVGRIAGGISQNVVPRTCAFDWEIRLLPWLDPDEIEQCFRDHADRFILPEMRRVSAEAGIRTERICDVPGLRPQSGSDAETLCTRILKTNSVQSVSFGSEAGLFQREGLATVICGPGEIAQAHRPDEYIEANQIEECERFMRGLAIELGATPN